MKIRLKLPTTMLGAMRQDLARPHRFAHERVGFVTAGATWVDHRELLLTARAYDPVADADYVPGRTVGVKIGPDAMRKALQSAYRPPSALLHVHTHGGYGRPAFSGVDRRSAAEFVPSFFNPVPRMPHGILVLSHDSATGLLWVDPSRDPIAFDEITSVGSPYINYGVRG